MQAACRIPQDIAITAVDAHKHPLVGALAADRGEITSLALWLLAERASSSSEAGPLVEALPVRRPECRSASSVHFAEALTLCNFSKGFCAYILKDTCQKRSFP